MEVSSSSALKAEAAAAASAASGQPVGHHWVKRCNNNKKRFSFVLLQNFHTVFSVCRVFFVLRFAFIFLFSLIVYFVAHLHYFNSFRLGNRQWCCLCTPLLPLSLPLCHLFLLLLSLLSSSAHCAYFLALLLLLVSCPSTRNANKYNEVKWNEMKRDEMNSRGGKCRKMLQCCSTAWHGA